MAPLLSSGQRRLSCCFVIVGFAAACIALTIGTCAFFVVPLRAPVWGLMVALLSFLVGLAQFICAFVVWGSRRFRPTWGRTSLERIVTRHLSGLPVRTKLLLGCGLAIGVAFLVADATIGHAETGTSSWGGCAIALWIALGTIVVAPVAAGNPNRQKRP